MNELSGDERVWEGNPPESFEYIEYLHFGHKDFSTCIPMDNLVFLSKAEDRFVYSVFTDRDEDLTRVKFECLIDCTPEQVWESWLVYCGVKPKAPEVF